MSKKTEYNGELTNLVEAHQKVEAFKVKNAKILDKLEQLQAEYGEHEKAVKKVAQEKVIEINKGETKATKQDYTFKRDNLEILGYPSFTEVFDVNVLDKKDLDKLLSLGCLTVDAKAYHAQIEGARIPESIDAKVRQEKFKGASVRIKFK